jgi:alpha,alpha-trehalase
MKYLFSELDFVIDQIRNRHVFLFLDFDGTLAPIAEKPQDAVMSCETRDLLAGLSKQCNLKVAVISGRSLADIKRLTAVEGIMYAGNHGMEMEGRDFQFACPLPDQYRDHLKKISDVLHPTLADIEGVVFEDKYYSLCIHYRGVRPERISCLNDRFRQAISAYLRDNSVQLRYGKMVFELRPPLLWDKGRAVLWLLERQKTLSPGDDIYPIYIGDDETDEDAFTALKNSGLTVIVGKSKKSAARCYLRDTADVTQFLRQIAEAAKS